MQSLLTLETDLAARVCLTLAHSLWQFALLAALAWLGSRCVRSVSKQYLLHVCTLLLGLLLVPANFVVLGEAAAPLKRHGQVVPEADSLGSQQALVADRIELGEPVLANNVKRAVGNEESLTLPNLPGRAATVARHEPENAWHAWAHWLMGFYFGGVLLMLARLALAFRSAARLAETGVAIEDGVLPAFVKRLSDQWKLRVVPVLKQTENVVVPKVVGLLLPTILLPTSAIAGLTQQELEMILAHELAHVRRADMWVNLVQRLAEAVLFFNPALWYLSRRISTLREYCCDELACEVTQVSAKKPQFQYAQALLRVVELAGPAPQTAGLAASAASGSSPSELRRRVARLFGEPLHEPVRLTRGGIWSLLALGLLVVAGPLVWAERGEEKPEGKPQAEGHEIPPLTAADRAVAAARAKSLGLKQLDQFYVTGVQEGGVVRGMEKLPAGNAKGMLLKLWFARDQELGEQARYLKRIKTAWNRDRLVLTSSIVFPGGPRIEANGIGAYMSRDELADGETKPSMNVDTKYWDGKEGWWHQSSSAGPAHNGRYAKATDLFDQTNWYDMPLMWALDNQLPWPGNDIHLEHEVDPELTRYRKIGSEKVTGSRCDVYEGPARREMLWIDAATGLIRAKCRYDNSGTRLPNYHSELVKEVAGRTFETPQQYHEWYKRQPPELQARALAHWSEAYWHLASPGALFVYSDYQEIAPGVQWPMRCDRLIVHANAKTAKYYRNTTRYQVPKQPLEFDKLVAKALPKAGDKVTDLRFDVPVEYLWSEKITERQVTKWLEGKRKEKPRKVGDWKQVEPPTAKPQATGRERKLGRLESEQSVFQVEEPLVTTEQRLSEDKVATGFDSLLGDFSSGNSPTRQTLDNEVGNRGGTFQLSVAGENQPSLPEKIYSEPTATKPQAVDELSKTEKRLKELRRAVSESERAAQAALSDMQAKLRVMQSKPIQIAQLEGDRRRWNEASKRWADARAEHAKANLKLKAESLKRLVIDERKFAQDELQDFARDALPPVPKGAKRLTIPFAGTAGDVVNVKTLSLIQPSNRWLEKHGTRFSEGGVPVVLDYIPPAEVPLRAVEKFHEWIEGSGRGDFINGLFMGQGPVAVRGAKIKRVRAESWEEATQLTKESLLKQFTNVKPGGFITVGRDVKNPEKFSHFAVLTKEREIAVCRVVHVNHEKKAEMLIDMMKVGEPPAKGERVKEKTARLEVRPARVLLDQDEIKVAQTNNDPRLVKFATEAGKIEWLMLAEGEALFTEHDLDEATPKVAPNEKNYSLRIELNEQAGKRMRRETAKLFARGGDPLLRLSVLVDGKVLMAPRLMSVLGGEMELSGNFTKEEVEGLAARIMSQKSDPQDE